MTSAERLKCLELALATFNFRPMNPDDVVAVAKAFEAYASARAVYEGQRHENACRGVHDLKAASIKPL